MPGHRATASTILRILPIPLSFLVWACGDANDPTALTLSEEGQDEAENGATNGQGLALGKEPFIIVLGDDEDPGAVARDHGVQPQFVFSKVFKGFSGSISEAARAGLLRDARVRRIAPDQAFSITEGVTPAGSWGLDRIDQRTDELDQTYHFLATGDGVTAYVVDTGIRFTHNDFGGRATFGFDAFGGDGSDCRGHGTHVAGIVGGTTFGVAKNVSLVSVRVLNCSGMGTTSSVVAGLEWIVENAALPAVVNMSLGGGADDLLDEAVRRVIEYGIPVVVAAGNKTANACDYSPARVPEAMTIAATAAGDTRASWSNWGMCVDWFAPGADITSDGHSDDDAFAIKSGTSMASPHTAGAAALFLEAHPTASPQDVADGLATLTTKGVVASSFSPASDLLYTLDDGSDGNGGNTPPVAEFSAECSGLTCQFADLSWDPDGTVVAWQWDFGDQRGEIRQNPSHTYAIAGTYPVTLIVRDNLGVTSPTTYMITVGIEENTPPVAAFSVTCTGLSCVFLDESTDSDGSVVAWEWDFGDQNGGEQRNSSHTYAAGGVFFVTLTVQDNAGGSGSTSHEITVEGSENEPPVAAFSVSCIGLSCDFQDESTDPDGTISQWNWDFGDGASMALESEAGLSHAFPTGGIYRVTLTVVDDGGASGGSARDVLVENRALTLVVEGSKEKGRHVLDLFWQGATTPQVEVHVTNLPSVTVDNTGTYRYVTTDKRKQSYVVSVCEVGTGVCSAEQTVSF